MPCGWIRGGSGEFIGRVSEITPLAVGRFELDVYTIQVSSEQGSVLFIPAGARQSARVENRLECSIAKRDHLRAKTFALVFALELEIDWNVRRFRIRPDGGAALRGVKICERDGTERQCQQFAGEFHAG